MRFLISRGEAVCPVKLKAPAVLVDARLLGYACAGVPSLSTYLPTYLCVCTIVQAADIYLHPQLLNHCNFSAIEGLSVTPFDTSLCHGSTGQQYPNSAPHLAY